MPYGDPSIATRPLYDEAFAVAVPAHHPWAGRTTIKANELSGERVLLLNSGHCFSNTVVEVCPELARKTNDVQQGNSLETIRSMVASGLGIAVLPLSACSDRFQSRLIRTIPFKAPAPSRRIALAWRKSFAREGPVQAVATAVARLRLANVDLVTAPGARASEHRA